MYRPYRRSILVLMTALLVSFLLPQAPAEAQVDAVFDQDGNLIRMPFEPDLPVVRSVVRQERGSTWFLTFVAVPYDTVVEHYQVAYQRQMDLAPGWHIVGHGFDVGADAFTFTLAYHQARYAFQVVPDPDSSNTILRIRSNGWGAATQAYLHSVAPFRPNDLDPVDFNDL